MSTTIPRIYETYGAALEAVAELKKNRYRDDEISLISNAPNREPGETEDAATEIAKSGIPAENVGAFAAVVAEGKSLLVVRAVWGAAAKAIRIVDSHGPSDAGIGRLEYYAIKQNEKSVFSSTFGLPMLWTDATPFSKFWNLPVLLSNATPFSSMFTFPTLWSGFLFGSPKLIDDGAIFSNELRIPVLLKKTAPAS